VTRVSPEVLVVSQLPPPVHGSTVMTGILLDTLRELGVEPLLVDRRFSRRVSQVGRFSVAKVVRGAGLELRLVRALVTYRPRAVILFTTTSTWSALVDAASTAMCSALRVPVVHYLHTEGMSRLASRGRFWRWIVSFMLSHGRMVVASSEGAADDVRGFVPAQRIEVIPNTIVGQSKDPTSSPNSARTVLFLSNLLPAKGAADFVELAHALADEFEQVSFVLAGAPADPSHAAELARRVDEFGLAGRVRLIGAVTAEQRSELMLAAELFVFPSHYPETTPLVVLEALAGGVPVAAYRVPGRAGIVDDGLTGFLVPMGAVDELAGAARKVLQHPELRPGRSAACRRRFELEFSRGAYRAKWQRLLPMTDAGPATARVRGNAR
jgi:glycosyltransferase involved in cell wall biosynthesis